MSVNNISVQATTENLDTVIGFVDEFLEELGCSMKTQMQIDLCVEEMYINIANYAYGDDIGEAEIEVSENCGEVSITMKDRGVPYNPLEKPDPDTTLSAEERQVGGLGIFIVKKIMDTVLYEYKDGQNIFTMTKKL